MRRAGVPAEDGFVLPAVLVVLAAVAITAAIATERFAVHLGATSGRAESLRLQGLADGAARLVAASLLNERQRGAPGLGLPEDGLPVGCPVPGARLLVAVQDQAGLIDLNASPRPLLEAAFRALGLPDREAGTVAAEVVDYRDPDSDPEPNGGAEAPQYRDQGLPYGPRNAPFRSPAEIGMLPHLGEVEAARLRPFLTVYNATGQFDPGPSPLGALLGGTVGEALRPYAARSPRSVFAIRVVAASPSGRAQREAVLSAGSVRQSNTGLLSWQAGFDGAPALPEAAPHPACGRIAAALAAEDPARRAGR
ncbi:putative general secretion pathway protein K [Methylobacterium sp. 4-46]|uniref:general secretion pathway protein GspK n=1 Tax=unclassified Methylobacterium TaxID=2615210 RepID=UPI000152DF5E|nr:MULTISPECIES: type II secretion system protein GspK [Methylobacterium]ACA16111.1 putative general secretion pathway protein K [Methylobacterium sp. 4-46]WFT81820.1 type II secretion system protein GspK [Methylobacterium nodulans]